ncbi:THO complex subunit 5-like [Oopsacas minuta]|uniref:THO complex subunit 5-like n=1 Tax=Oopsacas minuta TaxID=111878 RepID=A0AAV7KFD8_9METZ|nr:THO complex subunit 5-like [Oopsacas minuta]
MSACSPFKEYKSYYENIRVLLSDLYEAKKCGKSASCMKLRQDANIYLSFLLDMNRAAHSKGVSAREDLQLCKEAFNKQLLQLENLLYHSQHLKKEIQSCLTLSSMHEQIEIIDESELTQLIEYSPTDGPHELMKQRLQWELQTRQRLTTQAKKLKEETSIRLEDNVRKSNMMTELSRVVERLSAKAASNENDLGMHVMHENAERVLAKRLVPPLYILFIETKSYCSCKQLNFEVKLVDIRKLAEEEEYLHSVQIFLKIRSSPNSVTIRFAFDTYDETVIATITELAPKPEAPRARWMNRSNLLTNLVVPSLVHDRISVFENLWVQCMGGLRPDANILVPNREIAQTHTGHIIDSLFRRVTSRSSLADQLETIANSGIDSNAKLCDWKLLSSEELKESLARSSSGKLLENFSPRDGHCYSGELHYEQYKLYFLVSVYFEYPDTPPFFLASLSSPLTRLEDRQQEWRMEKEINSIECRSEDVSMLLTRQMKLLAQMFVYYSELHRLQLKDITIINTHSLATNRTL